MSMESDLNFRIESGRHASTSGAQGILFEASITAALILLLLACVKVVCGAFDMNTEGG